MQSSLRLLPFALGMLGMLSGCSTAERLPPDVRQALDRADEIELISIDPSSRPGGGNGRLSDYTILGTTTLSGSEKDEVLRLVQRGIAASDGMVAACFIPRHGLRATIDGKTVELVICYQCMSIKGTIDGKEFGVLTARGPETKLNEILTKKGIPLPQQP